MSSFKNIFKEFHVRGLSKLYVKNVIQNDFINKLKNMVIIQKCLCAISFTLLKDHTFKDIGESVKS